MAGEIVSLPQTVTAPSTPDGSTSDFGVRARLIAGLTVVALLMFGLGGWAALAKLSGAVIAPGFMVVDNNLKKVQHPTGGVVGEILVKNGERVEAGEVLIRLDGTQLRAALGIVVSQLIELTGRKARLAAERDNSRAIEFPSDLESMGPGARRVMFGERRLFEAKLATANGQKAQLRERTHQLQEEIRGLSSQRDAKARELDLVRKELDRVTAMHNQKLAPITRVLAMHREETRIDGEHGALVSQIARAEGQISEVGLQILAIDQTRQSEAQRELRDAEAKAAELAERKIAAEDQLKRADLRAPLSGVVHELSVHTVGGVIGSGDPVLLIVPNDDLLIIEVRIPPANIDQVQIGQRSALRFPAFNQATTPELSGTVTHIAADLTRETQTGQSYYIARIKIDGESAAKMRDLKLIPGMPVEAYIATSERTALSYLLKPFTDQVTRALRD